jgi:hypothetical protein
MVSGFSEPVATTHVPVRAVDVAGNIAAEYRFSLDPTWQWFEDRTTAHKLVGLSTHTAAGRCTFDVLLVLSGVPFPR